MIIVNDCPFCAHDDVQIDEIDRHVFAVICPECECCGPVSRISGEDAIHRWNHAAVNAKKVGAGETAPEGHNAEVSRSAPLLAQVGSTDGLEGMP